MSFPGNPDLGTAYQARSQSAGMAQANSDLDSIIGGDGGPSTPGQVPSFQAPQGFFGKALNVAKAAPGDIAQGVIESPRQVVGGVLDAVGNASRGLDKVGDWLNSHVADLSVDVPNTGIDWVDRIGSSVLGAAGDPLKTISKASGAVSQPRSVTGAVLREGAQFMAGFIPALRASKLAGLGSVAAPIAAGAISNAVTTDPDKANLTAALAQHVDIPASLQPAVNLLSTNPNDPDLVNRARNLVEGLGFGGLTEGIFRGVKAVAAARRAMEGAPEATAGAAGADPMAAMKAQYGEIKPEAYAPLGDPAKPAISVTTSQARMAAAEKATDGIVGIPTDQGGQVFINFARINEPDDVKSAMDKMASAFKPGIDEATRGIQTNEETSKLADELGMSVDDLLSRRQGQPLNAEQAVAARRLWGASAQKLVDLAGRAADPNAGDVDRFMFRKMMATHYAIQAQVIGARTETARALQSWAIPTGGGVEQARAIQNILDASGGETVSTELAKRIASLSGSGVSQDAINAAVRKGWAATTLDGVREAYIMGLLWNPATHIVNSMSNGVVAAQQIAERFAAEKVGGMMGAKSIAPGEAAAMLSAVPDSINDAFRYAVKAMKTGEAGASIGKQELPFERAISSDAISRAAGHGATQAEAFKDSGIGRAVDWIGFANGLPGRALGGEDEFFKTIGYRMEARAQAVRQATSEGLTGEAWAQRYAGLVNDPPENIRLAAADAALYSTFQNQPSEMIRALMLARGKAGPLAWLVFPFVKTPANILSYTFERTPAAPLVARWRADVAAGGARRDLALTRMAAGSAAMMSVLDMADSGALTGAGPSNPNQLEALRRTGWQPYSIRFGDKYVSYNRLDPLAMPLAFSATIVERFKEAEQSKDDLSEWQEALGAGAATISQTVVDKSWFQGFSNLITAVQESRQGPGAVTNYINQQVGGMLPFSSLFNTGKRLTDPVTRQVYNPYDAIMAKLPILSQTLPARRDLWGQELKTDEVYGRAYDTISPLYVSKQKNSPVDAELNRLNTGVDRIGVKDTFDGVAVNFRDYPAVYDRFVRLAGNELQHPAWGQGAHDFLNDTVSGKSALSSVYEIMSDKGKADFIKNTVDEYRKLAEQEIEQNPQGREERQFNAMLQQRKDQIMQAKMGIAP